MNSTCFFMAVTPLCGYLLDSGHGRLVSTARPLPGTANSVVVFAEFALVMVRRTHGTKPVHESVLTDLPRVLERVGTQIAEDVSFQVPALFIVADVLDASDLSAGVVEVEVVKKEEAALQPLEGRPPADFSIRCEITPLQLPYADHHFQSFECGVRLRCLLLSLSVVVVCHYGFSFLRGRVIAGRSVVLFIPAIPS